MLYFNYIQDIDTILNIPHLIHNIFYKLISILQLTDFRGEPYPYDKDATWPDEYGVLATAIESDHEKYLQVFPDNIKGQIKDYYKKK